MINGRHVPNYFTQAQQIYMDPHAEKQQQATIPQIG